MTVVGEIGNKNQTQGFDVGSETFKGVDLATKFECLLTAFDPVAFVQFADDMEHFLAT
jgi:hypothetical protein